MYTSQVGFQMDFLPEHLVAKRTTEFRWYVVTTHHVSFQMVFEFKRTGAVFAIELWLYPALVLQMAGQRMFVFIATAARLGARPFMSGRITYKREHTIIINLYISYR